MANTLKYKVAQLLGNKATQMIDYLFFILLKDFELVAQEGRSYISKQLAINNTKDNIISWITLHPRNSVKITHEEFSITIPPREESHGPIKEYMIVIDPSLTEYEIFEYFVEEIKVQKTIN